MFSCKISAIFENTFFHGTPTVAASGLQKDFLTKKKSLKIICVEQANFIKVTAHQPATFLALSSNTDDLKCLNVVPQ